MISELQFSLLWLTGIEKGVEKRVKMQKSYYVADLLFTVQTVTAAQKYRTQQQNT